MKGLELGSAKVHDSDVVAGGQKESIPFRTAFTRIKERTSIRETARDISNGRKAFTRCIIRATTRAAAAIAQSCTARLTAGGSKTSFRTISALQAF